jgi:hypothetical protein
MPEPLQISGSSSGLLFPIVLNGITDPETDDTTSVPFFRNSEGFANKVASP